jgi:chromosomal replication initiation ATPase DnaA
MNDFTYQQTLPLKLLPSYGRHDFIVGESNLEAVKWVDNFSKSKVNGLVIIGPIASGKSHLISTLKNKYKILGAEEINEEKINILELKDLIIENIEKIENHYFFLHIINVVKERNYKVLLTSRLPIKELNIRLEDLKSRLLAYSHSKILLPTDDVLRGIIIKISKDKGLLLSDTVINYILSHLERSYSIINSFINELDQLSLIKKKKITIPFIKKYLESKR